MNKFFCAFTIAVSLLVVGCSGDDDDTQVPEPSQESKAPTVSEYRQVLEKRIASPDGANINIRQEIGKFENASDEVKRLIFKKVSDLAK